MHGTAVFSVYFGLWPSTFDDFRPPVVDFRDSIHFYSVFSRRFIRTFHFQLSFLLDSSLPCALRAFTRQVAADDDVVAVGSKQMDDDQEQQQPLFSFLFRFTISSALLLLYYY